MNPGLTLIAILHGKPEKRDDLLATLREFVKPTRAEEGCVEYHLHVSDDDPNKFFFYENWRSKPDLDVHLKTPLLPAFFNRRMDLLQKDVDMNYMTMESAYATWSGRTQAGGPDQMSEGLAPSTCFLQSFAEAGSLKPQIRRRKRIM